MSTSSKSATFEAQSFSKPLRTSSALQISRQGIVYIDVLSTKEVLYCWIFWCGPRIAALLSMEIFFVSSHAHNKTSSHFQAIPHGVKEKSLTLWQLNSGNCQIQSPLPNRQSIKMIQVGRRFLFHSSLWKILLQMPNFRQCCVTSLSLWRPCMFSRNMDV